MNKKILTGVMALCMVVSMTACGGNKTATEPTDTTSSEATVAESVEGASESVVEGASESVVEVETDGVAEGETNVGENLDGAVEGETEIGESLEGEATGSEEVAPVDEEHAAIVSAIEEVIASTEHAAMVEVLDPMVLSEFFLIDVEDTNIKSLVVYQCPMSATMSEIIVIKADDVEAAKEILEVRKQKAIDTDAWYPKDVENAEASIVDTCGNFAYFIINDNAADDAVLLDTLLSVL